MKLRELTINGLKYCLLFVLVQSVIFQIFCIEGTSMFPALKPGSWVFVNPLSPLLGSPSRNDIIVFKLPGNKRFFIKRIIGLPGEKVEIMEGRIYIDHKALETGYLPENSVEDFVAQPIPQGRFLVLGDNRNESMDSRSFGMVSEKQIYGQALCTLWPFQKSL